jgi:hypothetical protein
VLRGMAMLLRDAGAPLAAERFMHEAIQLYVRNPAQVAFFLVDRDNFIDFHEWTRFALKSELARALARRRGKPGAPRYPESFVLPEDRAALLDYAARESGASYRRGLGLHYGNLRVMIGHCGAVTTASPTGHDGWG